MKLVSLNTWCGKYFEALAEFIKQHAKDTDIFCFQEICSTTSEIKQFSNMQVNLLSEINIILPDFQVFFFPTLSGYTDEAVPVDFDLKYGQAIWIRKSIPVNYHKDYIICDEKSSEPLKADFSNLATPLQYLKFGTHEKVYALFNFHGTPYPAEKLDTPRHLLESRKVKEIMDEQKYAKILVGDFNLLPQTESIKMFETDMKNLIKEFNIERTRSNLSPFYGKPDFQKFADYTFVSNDIEVKSFEVPQVEISDHLPMILQFS